jgi:hypothetical protein
MVIPRDSSANKCGVISSYEIIAMLVLSEKEILLLMPKSDKSRHRQGGTA